MHFRKEHDTLRSDKQSTGLEPGLQSVFFHQDWGENPELDTFFAFASWSYCTAELGTQPRVDILSRRLRFESVRWWLVGSVLGNCFSKASRKEEHMKKLKEVLWTISWSVNWQTQGWCWKKTLKPNDKRIFQLYPGTCLKVGDPKRKNWDKALNYLLIN